MPGTAGQQTATAYGTSNQPTDYAQSSLGAIAKISSVNPMLGKAMMNAYQQRTPHSGGIMSGIWNVVTSPVKAVFSGFSKLSSAVAEPFRRETSGPDAQKHADPFWKDIYQGLSGQEHTMWKRNLLSYGWTNPWVSNILGFVGDVALDPTTYIGAGGLAIPKDILTEGTKTLAGHAALGVINREIAKEGGLRIGGHLVLEHENFANRMFNIGREALTNGNVNSEVVDGLAGLASANSERTLMASVHDVSKREVEWMSEQAASAITRTRNLRSLGGPAGKLVSPITGRVWSRSEITDIFEKTARMSQKQLIDLANSPSMYGKGTTDQIANMLGRKAAGAMGGVRLKFGIPFGQQMANMWDKPWLGMRWQTAALPYSSRFNILGHDVGFADIGNVFRGTAGIHRLDGAIQKSLITGDGIWPREAMDAFLYGEKGGFTGLRLHMANIGKLQEFNKVFGNKSVSTFLPWSERLGKFTEALTPGARAWRRSGYYGLKTYQSVRTAKVSKKLFRTYAAKYERTWAKAAYQFEQDANKGLFDKQAVFDHFIKFQEGLTDELGPLPEYLKRPAQEMRDFMPKLQQKARDMGADVGDLTEVFNTRRLELATKEIDKQLLDVEREIKKLKPPEGGIVDQSSLDLLKRRRDLTAMKDNIRVGQKTNEELDAMYQAARGGPIAGEKALPSLYYHRRFSQNTRSALIGNFQAETRVFNKAKKLTALEERKLAGLSFNKAEEAVHKMLPQLEGEQIFENNPMLNFAHYVDDMGEAVFNANLGKAADYLMNTIGGVDNGVITRLTRNMVDPETMPNTYKHVVAQLRGAGTEDHAIISKWLDDFEGAMGVKPVAQPLEKTKLWHYTKAEFSKANKVGDHEAVIRAAVADGQTVPTAVLREYPDLLEKMNAVPKNLTEPQMQRLQTGLRELNKLRAKLSGAEAVPELAFTEISTGINMKYWGKLDAKGLENYAMRPFMAAEFNRAVKGLGPLPLGEFQHAWRKFLIGPWKEWATVYWPGFHARNYMGAWFNNQLGGVQPFHYSEFHRVMDVLKHENPEESKWFTKVYPHLKRIDGQDVSVTYGHLASMAQDLGIVGGNNQALADLRTYLSSADVLSFEPGHRISRAMKFTGTTETKTFGKVTRAESAVRHWQKAGQDTMNYVENFMRGASFLKGLEEGGGDTAAARAFTMIRHGDYDELTDVENSIKDVVPFYKWMRTNIPFQIRQLIESPGKQLSVLDLQRNLNDPEEYKKLPDWMKEDFTVKLPKPIAKIFGAKEGAGYLTLQLPMGDILKSSNEYVSGFLPIVRQTIVENGLFRKSLFTGAPLEGTKTEKLGFWSELPGISNVLEASGIAQRDADGQLVTTDRWLNVMNAFPIFARSRNFLSADPDRTKLRMTAMVSAIAGLGIRPIGKDELNASEADYFFSQVKPQLDLLRGMGYQFPTISDFAQTAPMGAGTAGR